LKDWLPRYKFKGWLQTRTRELSVTPEMREERAGRIAERLSETKKWHSHGRGISKAVLEADPELDLQVKDFGENGQLSKAIRDYSNLLLDFAGKVQMPWFVHTLNGFVLPYGRA
jgi:hypothetical protein